MGTGFKHGERRNGLGRRTCMYVWPHVHVYSLAQFSKPKNNTTTANEEKYIYLNIPIYRIQNTRVSSKLKDVFLKDRNTVRNSNTVAFLCVHTHYPLDIHTCTPTICAQNHTWVLLYKYVHICVHTYMYVQ